MAVKVGINGFGRIGRQVFKAIKERHAGELEVVAINDLYDVKTNAHLFKFDSNYGIYDGTVEVKDGNLVVDGSEVRVFAERNPGDIPWKDLGAEIVIESTGVFRARESAKGGYGDHLKNGAKKVILTVPAKDEIDNMIVLGVNDDDLRPEDECVSNASCTTNCLSPVAKVLNDAIGITKGFMTTIHSYTGDQPTLDTMHKDLYRARAAALSMIPTSTGAAKAVGLVLPELNGKLDGVAIRVPTPNVSVVDLTFEASRDTTVEEVNAAAKAAAEGHMKGVLGYDPEQKVSIDFNHTEESCIFAPDQTIVVAGRTVRVLGWYDNEWAFSVRMADVAVAMGNLG